MILDENQFEFKDVMLTFNDCWDVMDFWLSTDPAVMLISQEELLQRQDPSNKIRITLHDTIKKYELMLQETQTDVERKVILSTIDTLKAQLAELDKPTDDTEQIVQARIAKREAKKLKSLKEIYKYYCKQHCKVGAYTTFDNIKNEMQVLSLGEFSFIVRDFQLLRSKQDKTVTTFSVDVLIFGIESCGGFQEVLEQ